MKVNTKNCWPLLLVICNLCALIKCSPQCPCQQLSLCNTINRTTNEIYAFVLESNNTVWTQFDWSKLTTIALVNFYDTELLCYAHQNNVRVVSLVGYSVNDLNNESKVEQWIDTQLRYVADRFMDGINIDIEDAIDSNSTIVDALSRFTLKVTSNFHQHIPGSQVTFDVPWSPYNAKGVGVDGRNYNYTALADATDFLFIMSYDQRSQIFDEQCIAGANSGLYNTVGGIDAYLNLGISSQKLVVGLPWYGYDYICISLGEENMCNIAYVPFRGVNCSDAAGTQLPYSEAVNIVATAYYTLDEHTQTPYSTYKVSGGNTVTHQLWFDNPLSLAKKISYVQYKQLRGVGVWNANSLDYSGSSSGRTQVHEMWQTLPNYK